MDYIIRSGKTYACDSYQGLEWHFEKDKAIKYDSYSQAEEAGKLLVPKGYSFIVEQVFNEKKEITKTILKIEAQLDYIKEILKSM